MSIKLSRKELKAMLMEGLRENPTVLREVVVELAMDGTLNEMFQQMRPPMPQNPMAHLAAQQIGKTPSERQMMENILADTAATTMQIQANAPDPAGAMMGFGQYPQQSYYPPQQMMGPQYVNVPPVQPLNYVQPPTTQPGQVASNWARLAFNSPIRNRPGSENGGGGTPHLPGQNMGRFG